MEKPLPGPIGLMADSHGRNDLLTRTILTLQSLQARTIIHLGDICDSLEPKALEEAVKILRDHDVKAVKGNNEYAILTSHNGSRRDALSPEVHEFLSGLPYTITSETICFAHSAPFDWPAATSWPITDSHPFVNLDDIVTCSILFRGHSHTPSILEVDGPNTRRLPAEAGMKTMLSRSARYVVTIGAVQEGSFALFRPDEHEIWFLRTDQG